MIYFWIIFIYLAGVAIAMQMVASYNAERQEIEKVPPLSFFLSWVIVLFPFLVLLRAIVVYPFMWCYEKTEDYYFKKYYSHEKTQGNEEKI